MSVPLGIGGGSIEPETSVQTQGLGLNGEDSQFRTCVASWGDGTTAVKDLQHSRVSS